MIIIKIKKNLLISISFLSIALLLILFALKQPQKIALRGTFSDPRNSIYFNESTGEYTYTFYENINRIENLGEFSFQDFNKYTITSGILANYNVEVYDNYIYLKHDGAEQKYIKVSENPFYTE